MIPLPKAAFGLAFIAVLAACADDSGSGAPSQVVRDSAGIRIVENVEAAWTTRSEWRVPEQPLVQIGAAEDAPEYQFARAPEAVRLSNGWIVVADPGTIDLRVFDAQGRYLHSLGRRGGGPGEYEAVTLVGRAAGDSIIVWDSRQSRVSIFAPTGELLREQPLDPVHGRASLRGRFADGTLLSAPLHFAGPPRQGARRDPRAVLRIAPDGALLDTIVVLAGDEQYIRTSAESGWGPLATITPVLFGRSSHLVLHGDRVYAGNTDRYEIAVYSPAGALETLIRRAAPNRAITDADLNVARAETISRFDDAESRRLFEEIFAAMPAPPTMPAFRSLSVDDDGNVWVQEYAPPGDAANEWTTFDPAGRMLGTVRLPEGLRPLHIGEDFVLGSWHDALDVPHVRLYAVDKSPESSGR